MNIKRLNKLRFFLVVLLIIKLNSANSFIIGSNTKEFYFDLPELWILENKSENHDRYTFSHQLFNAYFYLAIYPHEQFSQVLDCLNFVNEQFSEQSDKITFLWRHRSVAIGNFNTSSIFGWSLCTKLNNNQGWIALVGISSIDDALNSEDIIISTLDSLIIDEGSKFSPGPMTSFAWEDSEIIEGAFANFDIEIPVQFKSLDAQANQATVDREFRLLTTYIHHEAVFDAWKRYYRIIFKDAWKRFEDISFTISNYLTNDSRVQTEKLLSFVQSFRYERNLEGSDFLNLPEAFLEKKGDCDSRTLLMALLLQQQGTDAILLISPEFKHALIGVDCVGEGARFESNGKKYLLMDTTSTVGPGLIPASMADASKWFAIHFADAF